MEKKPVLTKNSRLQLSLADLNLGVQRKIAALGAPQFFKAYEHFGRPREGMTFDSMKYGLDKFGNVCGAGAKCYNKAPQIAATAFAVTALTSGHLVAKQQVVSRKRNLPLASGKGPTMSTSIASNSSDNKGRSTRKRGLSLTSIAGSLTNSTTGYILNQITSHSRPCEPSHHSRSHLAMSLMTHLVMY